MGVGRRRLLSGALVAAGGAVAGAAVTGLWPLFGPDRLPISGGYAPAGVARTWSPRGQVQVHWHVQTDHPLVALTFDDGPGPWTPMVLDALDRADAPATFFMVGERLAHAPELVRGRLDRHEVGNHTWAHRDLAQLDEAGVRDQLTRTHSTIQRLLGRTPSLMRPPWGHLGGSTLTVADELGYDVVMWSQQMREKQFEAHPAAQVRDIVDNAKSGHDRAGPRRRHSRPAGRAAADRRVHRRVPGPRAEAGHRLRVARRRPAGAARAVAQPGG